MQVNPGEVLSPEPGGHKTAHLKTLFVGSCLRDKTSPCSGGMGVTLNFQVAYVGGDLASVPKLPQTLLAGIAFSKVVFSASARSWEIRA